MKTRFAAALIALAAPLAACGDGDRASKPEIPATVPERADFQWVIPEGTKDMINMGKYMGQKDLFPAVMYAKVGQSIRIINQDSIGYTVGPFYIGPLQTLEQYLRSPGTFEGECTTHRGGRFMLIVEE